MLLLFNFSKIMKSHFQGASFGGWFHYQLLMVNMIQKGLQNVSVNTWKHNIHYFFAYSIFECSHLQSLISILTFLKEFVTLHEKPIRKRFHKFERSICSYEFVLTLLIVLGLRFSPSIVYYFQFHWESSNITAYIHFWAWHLTESF